MCRETVSLCILSASKSSNSDNLTHLVMLIVISILVVIVPNIVTTKIAVPVGTLSICLL
jgi:competence protein ComGC